MKTALEDAYVSWRRLPFPHGSSVDSVDELHADLVLADTWVTDTVVPFVEWGRPHKAAVPDVLEELRKLDARAVELGRDVSGKEGQLLQDYRDYVRVLSRVYEAFLVA